MPDQTADFFESLRPRLFGIAYRMLGIVADAEDVVQEAFLRWRQAGAAPRSDDAWLVSVTTRLSIDRLRRAGLTFHGDLVSGPGGRQILLTDPAGNLVELFEPADRPG